MSWISVKDKMPEPGTEVLAYACEFMTHEFKVIKAFYYDRYEIKGRKPQYNFHESCNCSGYDFDEMTIGEVTHWMPLPSTPLN